MISNWNSLLSSQFAFGPFIRIISIHHRVSCQQYPIGICLRTAYLLEMLIPWHEWNRDAGHGNFEGCYRRLSAAVCSSLQQFADLVVVQKGVVVKWSRRMHLAGVVTWHRLLHFLQLAGLTRLRELSENTVNSTPGAGATWCGWKQSRPAIWVGAQWLQILNIAYTRWNLKRNIKEPSFSHVRTDSRYVITSPNRCLYIAQTTKIWW